MLKPGGQLFFMGFEKNLVDDVYQKMDKGKWSKYNHSKSLSPFYNCENPVEEYKSVIQSLGYTDCHFFVHSRKDTIPEKAFNGKLLFLVYNDFRMRKSEENLCLFRL